MKVASLDRSLDLADRHLGDLEKLADNQEPLVAAVAKGFLILIGLVAAVAISTMTDEELKALTTEKGDPE